MEPTATIYVAGHRGLVGSALVRRLEAGGFTNLVLRTSKELDLRSQEQVNRFFETERPDYVFLAAAKVGGIYANNEYGADFIYDNLAIETNIIKAAKDSGVTKLMFLGSSCIYPRMAPQPMKEEYLLSGPLEETNKPYAVAKIAGIVMCQAFNRQYGTNFISVMPTNLYGPNDNFDLKNSHVLPALLRKVHEAKANKQPTFEVWGSGTPCREFLYVEDLADACLHLMETHDGSEIVNIGTGTDVTIRELAETIKKVVGYDGEIVFDASKPDGTPRKLLDVSRLKAAGWEHKTSLREGIGLTYEWYVRQPSRS
jgi:GDP-L-fucose synthase